MYQYEYETPSQDFSLASTQTASHYTGCSSECSEIYRVKLLICVKMFIAIITLLGGAILALCINVWWMGKDQTLEPTCPPTAIVHFFGDGTSYYQLKNVKTGLCFDDHILTNKWTFEKFNNTAKRLYLKPCDKNTKQLSRFFKYDEKSGHIGKGPYCLELNPLLQGRVLDPTQGFEWWLKKCKPNEYKQSFAHSKTLKQLYLTEHDVKYCITAKESDDAIIASVKACSDTMNKYQAWEFIGPLEHPK